MDRKSRVGWVPISIPDLGCNRFRFGSLAGRVGTVPSSITISALSENYHVFINLFLQMLATEEVEGQEVRVEEKEQEREKNREKEIFFFRRQAIIIFLKECSRIKDRVERHNF